MKELTKYNFEVKTDFIEITTLASIFGLLILGNSGLIISFTIIVFFMLKKREWLVKGVLYALFVRFANPVLFPLDGSLTIIFSWSIVLISFVKSLKLFYRERIKIDKFILFLVTFVCYVLIVSAIKSPYWMVSLFKIIGFSIGFFSIYFSLSLTMEYNWENFIFNVALFFIIVSTPLFFFKSIGMARNGWSFQGITNHPQAYGVFLSILLSFITVSLFSNSNIKKTKSLFWTGIISVGFFHLFMTHARTGIFSLFLSFMVVFLLFLIGKGKLRNNSFFKRMFSERGIFLVLLVILAFLINYSTIISEIKEMAYKEVTKVRIDSYKESGFEKIVLSRKGLVINSLNNFYQEPLTGIGFGIPSNRGYADINTFVDVPISASIEKGNLFIALLEETGLIGLFLFILFIGAVFLKIIKSTNVGFMVLFLTAFLCNMGEMVFFSTNGSGTLIWFALLMPFFRIKYLVGLND